MLADDGLTASLYSISTSTPILEAVLKVQPASSAFSDHTSGVKSKNSLPSSTSPSSSPIISLLFNRKSPSVEHTYSLAMSH